jgi:hypothetical protein
VEWVVRDMAGRHEQHAPRLVQHELRGPTHGFKPDARRLVVRADGV